ncbi:MAG: hypothetical protein K8W52_22535 [Deltaproteobacteria bacterium]|nr:hypothetical protein [Deltaproteobacteria bacterium]
MLRPWARRVRPDQLPLVDRAVAILVLANAAAAMAGVGADALFLVHVGSRYLGWALAGSSLLVVAVLAMVGGATDRRSRSAVLTAVAAFGAVAAAIVAALAVVAPAVAGAIAVVLLKQIQTAVDLVVWVVLAERFDARQSARLVPVWAAAAGVGSALGGLVAVPLANLGGPAAELVAAAICWSVVALVRIGDGGRLGAVTRARVGWADGARAVARYPLARRLAVLVAAAGGFASLAFYVLGATAAREITNADELAGFLGGFRSIVQVVTLLVQVTVAPRLLARVGVAGSLLIAPIAAVLVGAGEAMLGTLVFAALLQGQARLLDAAIETPAEKLAQNLLPVTVRGRIAGFLDGAAKRMGAVIGGVLAAVLAGTPTALAIVTLAVAGTWLAGALALRRRLPALAVAALTAAPPRPERDVDGDDDEALAVASDAVVTGLIDELGGDEAARAAEILARLHARGRIDAIGPLAAAAIAAPPSQRRGVVAALALATEARVPDRPGAVRAIARALGTPAEVAADPGELAARREALVRALGVVADRDDAAALAALAAVAAADPPAPVAIAAAIARARVRGDVDELDRVIDDALDDDAADARMAGARDLRVEVVGATARPRVIDRGHRLVRVVRRPRRFDDETRALALLALARALRTHADGPRKAEHVLLDAEVTALARELADRREPESKAPAPVAAAALRVLATAPDPADPETARLFAAALGDPDDDVRDAGEAGLARLGAAAIGHLVTIADFGRRAARDRAVALLGALPVTGAELDRLLEAELDALDRTCAHLGLLAELGGGAVGRRLDERAREIAHTVLLLCAARLRSRPIAEAARVFARAPDAAIRARALAVIDAALPRALVGRLVHAIDDLPAAERGQAAAERLGDAAPDRDQAIRAELAGGDRLARALVLHALDADDRATHREAIAAAATQAAAAANPLALLRRINDATDLGERDVPTRVETMLILGDLPLLAQLTARQLADLAAPAVWRSARAGDVVIAAGEPLDALVVVADGELAMGASRFGRGQAIDELAWFAPASIPDAVVATRATRFVRIERLDFDELVDDVPGLAAAVCRVLGGRARAAR